MAEKNRRATAQLWTEANLKPETRELTEAEEQSVHTHGVDAEEAVGDQVRSHHHCLQDKGEEVLRHTGDE